MHKELDQQWENAVAFFEDRFGQDMDLNGMLFMIGVQELGHGYAKLSKDQKLDVMHIAICKLLTPYGYYRLEGVDEAGWPHYERTKRLPNLQGEEQQTLMKNAIIEYLEMNHYQ